MSTGTKLIKSALARIGVSSVVRPVNPESMETGRDVLNGMYAKWQDDDIEFGAVPLKAVGDEFSEPLGLTNTVELNLALELQPFFEGSNLSPMLVAMAQTKYQEMKRKYKVITIPKAQVRGTLPKGSGDRYSTFFDEGEEIG